MTAEQFIFAAIDRLQSAGLGSLDADQRLVALISEAGVCCDMDGIDSFVRRYPTSVVQQCAQAFSEIGAVAIAAALRQVAAEMPNTSEAALIAANDLITSRYGYDYDAIVAAVKLRRSGAE